MKHVYISPLGSSDPYGTEDRANKENIKQTLGAALGILLNTLKPEIKELDIYLIYTPSFDWVKVNFEQALKEEFAELPPSYKVNYELYNELNPQDENAVWNTYVKCLEQIVIKYNTKETYFHLNCTSSTPAMIEVLKTSAKLGLFGKNISLHYQNNPKSEIPPKKYPDVVTLSTSKKSEQKTEDLNLKTILLSPTHKQIVLKQIATLLELGSYREAFYLLSQHKETFEEGLECLETLMNLIETGYREHLVPLSLDGTFSTAEKEFLKRLASLEPSSIRLLLAYRRFCLACKNKQDLDIPILGQAIIETALSYVLTNIEEYKGCFKVDAQDKITFIGQTEIEKSIILNAFQPLRESWKKNKKGDYNLLWLEDSKKIIGISDKEELFRRSVSIDKSLYKQNLQDEFKKHRNDLAHRISFHKVDKIEEKRDDYQKQVLNILLHIPELKDNKDLLDFDYLHLFNSTLFKQLNAEWMLDTPKPQRDLSLV
jgi:hypothetical protein